MGGEPGAQAGGGCRGGDVLTHPDVFLSACRQPGVLVSLPPQAFVGGNWGCLALGSRGWGNPRNTMPNFHPVSQDHRLNSQVTFAQTQGC